MTAIPLALMPWPRRLRWLDAGRGVAGAGMPELPAHAGARLRLAVEGLPPLPLRICCDGPDDGLPPRPEMDESYLLRIDAVGVRLQGRSVFGLLRGVQTLRQLLDDPLGLPHVEIEDAPRFAWRGLLLDSARRFLPLATLKRQLDGMAAAKLNVLHWHLTDDQAWRLASARYPRLQTHASAGAFYTPDEARELVAHAAERGIRVVPEMDLPGHTTALAAAYPELFSAPGPYLPERGFGVFKPCLDPRKPEVYDFLDALIGEWAAVFPDPCLHIGGDEVEPAHWQALGLDAREAQAGFNARLARILARHGKRMVGWDEVGDDPGGWLPADTVLQSWRGPDALQRLARSGHPVLLSAGFYLDQPQASVHHWRHPIVADTALAQGGASEAWHLALQLPLQTLQARLLLWPDGRGCIAFDAHAPQPLRWRERRGELSFALDTWMGETAARLQRRDDGVLQGHLRIGNVRYVADGQPVAELTAPPSPAPWDAASAARVLGGEIALWGELVGPEQLDLRLWPRAFAVAERFWSPLDTTDEAGFYRRLDRISAWAAGGLGLRHEAQHLQGLQRLAGVQWPLLQRFAALLEPGQYYARQHARKLAGRYHLDEPLDRLADCLPAESRAMRQPLSDALLRQCQQDQPALLALLVDVPQLQALLSLAGQLPGLCALGLALLDGEPVPVDDAHARLDAASAMVDEVVLALVPALEALLEARR
jgi:hexosaminidase